MKLKKNDQVIALLGKDKGKKGKIEKVYLKEARVLVPGLNIYKKHVKAREGVQGGIIDKTRPIAISKLALVCPKCGKQTRVGYQVVNSEKHRICKKCKSII